MSEADYMAVDLDELPAKVGTSTVYKVWRDPNDQEDCWAGVYHILVEQSNPKGYPVQLYFIKDGQVKAVANNATNDAGLTHWTSSYGAHLDTLLTAEEIWITKNDEHGNCHVMVISNPAKGGK